MTERILVTIVSPNGKARVQIVHRADGAYTYRQQHVTTTPSGLDWGLAGPDAGIYDSAETAEREARSRVWWLRTPVI